MKQLWNDSFNYMKSLGMESVSGTGSTYDATKTIRERLPVILRDFDVHSMADIPCGDFHWMSQVPMPRTNYFGFDIVEENIAQNIWKYTSNGVWRAFGVRDITVDPLPRVDLIFCRDCLVHFSDEDVWKALRNIYESGSTHLMTTTFRERKDNHDVPTGGWRTLNLEITPFNFPKPIAVIDEECPEQDGAYKDKCLAMWKIEDLKEILNA